MKTKAIFQRKINLFNDADCVIGCIVDLEKNQYDEFRENMLCDYPFIRDNIEFMYTHHTDDRIPIKHCLLILGEGCPDGVLVESQGYNYARYAALLPNARGFVQNRITELADALVKNGAQKSENGCWIIGFDDIKEHYDVTVSPNNGIGTLLLDELRQREEVAEIIATEDCFEMTYYLENCPPCHDGSNRLRTLISMLGCNFEDVHLCHHDEEHDLATISELNENTLTEQGEKDWADVLNAKVQRIFEGYYGLQIELSGVKPSRLRDFSYMLAGQCSIEDYSKWVTPQDNQQGLDDPRPEISM